MSNPKAHDDGPAASGLHPPASAGTGEAAFPQRDTAGGTPGRVHICSDLPRLLGWGERRRPTRAHYLVERREVRLSVPSHGVHFEQREARIERRGPEFDGPLQ